MNKKKIEKQIQKNMNITPNFSNIKNKIDFGKYTKEIESKKETNQIKFKFNYWRLATPLAMVIVLIIIFLQKEPNPNMQNPSGLENSSVVVSTPDTMNSAPAMSKPTAPSSSSPISSNISSSPDLETESPEDDTSQCPEGPTTPGENESPYSEMNGYFYFEQIYDESIESITELCFVRYAFDYENSYDMDSYVKIRAYIGVNLISSESISLSFEMNGESVYYIENIDETYTYSFFKDELYKPYISLIKYVEFDIKLANLVNSQGTLDLNVKSLNNDYIDINNDVIYYFISDNEVVLY